MRSIIAISIAALFMAGCATNTDYKMYAETQAKIAQARAVAETAKYNALAEIAKSGDSAAKVAAVLSIQMGNMGGGSSSQQNQPAIAAPEDLNQKLLRWAGVILPTVTQGLGIAAQLHAANVQKQIAVTQSNNAAATAQSTNNTFATMSTNMANSNTTIATAGLNAVQTTAANGFTAIQNVSTAGVTGTTNAVTNTSTGYTTALQAAINKLSGTTTTTTNNNFVCPAGQTLVNGSCL